MKHSALSMLLLLGLGFSPMLGGGNIYYGKVDPEIQQNASIEDGSEAKKTIIIPSEKKASEHVCVAFCVNKKETAGTSNR